MATYILGDIQGCFRSLETLLEHVGFTERDALWCVGDLVNRGAGSLPTLRFARALGDRFRTVLGNHDLHFLAMVYGGAPHRGTDTMQELLAAPDRDELADWLRRQPMCVEGEDWVLVHAGIPHVWDLATAAANARELEDVLRGEDPRPFFSAMYGNEPARWDGTLAGQDRYRLIANYFTRMRLVAGDGRLDFDYKDAPGDLPPGFLPWFSWPPRHDKQVIFGHWASLDGVTGTPAAVGLDTGCVWGRTMTALRLEDRCLFTVPSAEATA